MITEIPISQLYYDADPVYGRENLKGFYKAFKELEITLPEVPSHLKRFVERYYPRLINVFGSIKEEGIRNPIIVREVGPKIYRILVGNQRILSLNAIKHEGTVPCQITIDSAKTVQDKSVYEYIEGCEEARKPKC